jgi:cytochrome c556
MDQQLAITNNATAIYQRMSDPMEAVVKMGKMFAASGMFGCAKEEQGQVLALACMVQGKDPFELMQNYYIINGSLSMKSVAVLANFMKAGGKVKWHSALNDTEQAMADFEIGDNQLEQAAYTIEDAKRENLVTGPNKANWTQRPADMLRARLITKAVRMLAPGIIMGMSEETDAPQPGAAPAAPLLATATSEPTPEQPMSLSEVLEQNDVSVADAEAFLRASEMLAPEKGITDLTPTAQKRIMKNIDSFKEKVRVHLAAVATS